ncbi:MAG: DUF1343 domain-containing protein [Bacteroidales bacterium]|nr:DUF1343 domain-containing protein [Bacteroidales bacterium]
MNYGLVPLNPVVMRYFYLAMVLLLSLSCSGGKDRVILGDERLGEYIPLLEGKRVAIFSNQTGIVGDVVDGKPSRTEVTDQTASVPFHTIGEAAFGPHLLDVLLEKGIDVTAIFSPEHGFRGTADAGEHVSSSVDEKTGVPILSLYEGGKGRPSDESMSKFDVLVVDIQDVGLRYYTYYVTMMRLMNACSLFDKEVVILDRPNPNGFYVDGPILKDDLRSGVGALPIPIVHGMTLGELALMMNGENWLESGKPCDLTVIPCENYTHSTKYSLILPPSPNLKDMRAVYLYSSICFFEGTEISLGRGTDHPFEMYGHPDMTGYDFSFTPRSVPGAKNPPLLDRLCHGVDLSSKPLEEIFSEKINLGYVIDAYSNLGIGEDFFLGNGFFNLLTGNLKVKEDIMAGKNASQISSWWREEAEEFREKRKPYLLYPE